MAFYLQSASFHNGEEQIQKAMKVDMRDDPTVPTLSPQLANHLRIAPLLAIGTLDRDDRPWTTLWGGEPGLAQAFQGGVAGVRTTVPSKHDPVVEALFGEHATGEVIQETGQGRMVSGLTIDLEKRKRVKLFGRMIAGALTARDDEVTGQSQQSVEVQLALKVEQSLGNCPKYVNCKHIERHTTRPELVSDDRQLPAPALDLLQNSDMFFMSSCGPHNDMDTNHRGGPQGFVRVMSNEPTGAVMVYPEYSGNRLYQTLGNLAVDPRVGICVPNFETGDVLYISGLAKILIESDAAAVLPRSNLAVQVTLVAARFVRNVLPFRGRELERSPYNPKVRYLNSEKPAALPFERDSASMTATLISQTSITPSISRFRFRLSDQPKGSSPRYQPGQYVTFDFAPHLNIGYSHMRDDDPLSINDDFVRTFTVSNAPISATSNQDPNDFEITIRSVGPATKFLFQHRGTNNQRFSRGDLDIEIKGFGGEFQVKQPADSTQIAFIAAGVGITPLLPSLDTLDFSRLHVLWSTRAVDLSLIADVVAKYPGLAERVEVFVSDLETAGEDVASQLRDTGVRLIGRRLLAHDLQLIDEVATYYVCTSVPMRNEILTWLPGKEVLYEDFNF